MGAMLNVDETCYIEEGKKDGLPVVLVHGMVFDHRMWLPQIDALRDHFRVIAYDVRGHGKSAVGDGQYTHRMFAEDVVALMDHLQIERAVMCGLSMGGAISLRTIELYPERIRALVLCDCHSAADSNEAKYWRELAIKAVKQNGLETFADVFVKKLFAPRTFSTRPDIVELIRSMVLGTSPLAVCGALLAQAARTDTTDTLPGIKVPTLLLCGEEDTLTPPSLMRSMHEKIPLSELRIISCAGHVSNLENPDEFNGHLVRFLDKLR
ncbi:MAG TPA: alpha/beta fold hydrolase [Geobacteraceae bacterium]|nr:alpha/beta fold hydrolase [Geobacteraceae bacterium]